MPGFNDIHKFINAGLWPRSWPRPGPMNLLETDLRHVQDFVLSTNNEYLLVPSETFPLSPSLSLSCSLCLSFARLLALSLSFARLFVLSFSFTRLVALSFSFVRLLALSLSFARLLALSLSQRCSCCFFRYFFLFCFTKLAKVIKTR